MMRNHKIVSTVNAVFLFRFFFFPPTPLFCLALWHKRIFTNFSLYCIFTPLFLFLFFLFFYPPQSFCRLLYFQNYSSITFALPSLGELFVSLVYLLCDGSRTLIRSHCNWCDWGGHIILGGKITPTLKYDFSPLFFLSFL